MNAMMALFFTISWYSVLSVSLFPSSSLRFFWSLILPTN